MKHNKFNILFLSVIILFTGTFCVSCSGLDKKSKELTELENSKIQKIQEKYFSKIDINGFSNFSKITKTKRFYDDLININKLKYGENLVLATVNGWDITLNEIVFTLALNESLEDVLEEDIIINKQTYELYLDKIIKTKIYYSIALGKDLLPEKTTIYEIINKEKEIWDNAVPMTFSDLMKEEFYWQNYLSYSYFGLRTKMNVFNYILQEISIDLHSKEAVDYFNTKIQKEQNKADIDIIRQLKIPES